MTAAAGLEDMVLHPNQDDGLEVDTLGELGPDSVYWHLLPSGRKRNDPLAVQAAIRREVEGFGELATTFTIDQAVPEPFTRKAAREEHLEMVGAWLVPKAHTGTASHGRRFVNPDAIHRTKYTEAVTRCECGLVMARLTLEDGPGTIGNQKEHGDCAVSERLRARARLCEARAEAIRTSLYYGHSARQAAARLGYDPDNSGRSVGAAAEGMDIDIGALREEANLRKYRTEAILAALGYTSAQIGAALGRSAKTIRAHFSEYHPWEHTIKDWNRVDVPFERPDGSEDDWEGLE